MGDTNVGTGPLVAKQPRGIGEILSEAFELYNKNTVLLIVTAAVAMGPIYLVKDAIIAVALAPVPSSGLERDSRRMEDLQKQMEDAQRRGAPPEEIQRIARQQMETALGAGAKGAGALAGMLLMVLGLLVTIPFIVLAGYLAQAALTVVVADRKRGGTMDWQAAWRVVIRNLPGLLVTSILVFVGVAIGLVLCIVPGIIFGLLCAFSVPVVLLEKKSGTSAIQRSIELVRADWLRVAVVLIVFGILKAVTSWLGGLLVPTRSIFLHEFLGDLISIAVLPIPIIGLVLLYQDIVRSRMNVTDAQLRAQQDGLLA